MTGFRPACVGTRTRGDGVQKGAYRAIEVMLGQAERARTRTGLVQDSVWKQGRTMSAMGNGRCGGGERREKRGEKKRKREKKKRSIEAEDAASGS